MSPIRVALVTGSGKRRVGWHVAQVLADRGYALIVHYHTSKTEAAETVKAFQARGIEAVALQADLTDERSVQALIDQTLARFHRIDVLVNCAADWKSKRLEDVTAADVAIILRQIRSEHSFVVSERAWLWWISPKAVASSRLAIGPWHDPT